MRRLMMAAMMVVASAPAMAAADAYVLLKGAVEGHAVEDGLSRDVTSRICPRVTVEALEDAVAEHSDLKFDEQDYDNLYLKAGDMIWSLTTFDWRGSKSITVRISPHTGACAAYLYLWTL